MQTPVQKPVENLAPGTEVSCPKCGTKGRVGVDRFKAAGKTYLYLTVRHYENGRVRRCVLGPYQGSGTDAKALGRGTSAEVPEVKVPERPQGSGRGTNAKVPEAKTEVKTGAETPGVAGEVSPVQLDRAAWYVTKLLLAYGTYRVRQDEESYKQLLNVLKQVRERLQVDVSSAEAALAKLHAQSTTDAVIAATTAVKELVKAIIARILVPGTQAPVQVPLLETGNLVQSLAPHLREVVREEVGRVVESLKVPQTQEVRVEVPKEVVESIQMVRDQIQAMQREVEYIKEQVRQRKGFGARAVVRGEKRVEFREGTLYWMLREVMKQGGEWTKEALVDEIRRRFGKEVSGNSVSGRLSELAAAGHVAGRREGRTWLWRWTGT